MCMALGEALVVLSIRTAVATVVTGAKHIISLGLFSLFRQLLLCRVALGKSFLQFSAMKMAHAPPGHHSVVGR